MAQMEGTGRIRTHKFHKDLGVSPFPYATVVFAMAMIRVRTLNHSSWLIVKLIKPGPATSAFSITPA